MTDSVQLPEAVLSHRLAEAVHGRRLRSAVFTTFSFDPGFFELQVLPLLFSQSFSQVDKVRLLQLEDAMRHVEHLAVYYDRSALSQDAEPARLDYRRIDVNRPTGVFHPKLVFLLVDQADKASMDRGEPYRSLIVACLSANLTRAGWWESVECAHIEEIGDRDQAPTRVSYRRDLLAILRRIRACTGEDEDHRALDAVRTFLVERVSTRRYARESDRGRWHTRLFGGLSRWNLANWLAERGLAGRDWNLEVVSPYFNARGTGPLGRLVEVIAPRETRVYLPCDAEGTALVTADAYSAISSLESVQWANLPGRITRRSSGAAGERLAPRHVHAKIYRLWREEGRSVVLVGSVNCTSAAHGHGGAGNLEAAFLVDISDENLGRGWWLRPLERETNLFMEVAPDESDGLDNLPFGVSIRYDWGDHTLAIRFTRTLALPIEVQDVSGRPLFTIIRGDVDRWRVADAKAADAVRESLRSSSFMVLRRDEAQWRVLVREEGMAHRPSILSELSPDEILEYWSLLSAEERAAFLEHHAALGARIEGILAFEGGVPLGRGDTLFDRFAGVFHAFGCLRRYTEKALADGRYRDAETRLLGAKYDSLPELLRKILEREDGDPILDYVTFLTARQIRDSLENVDGQFFRDRLARVRELDGLIARGIEGRDSIFPDDDTRAREFLAWFEPAFLKDLGEM